MPRSEDWEIGVRRMLKNDPEFPVEMGPVEMGKDIRELLVTGNDEDQRVARRMVWGCWSRSLKRTPSCWKC